MKIIVAGATGYLGRPLLAAGRTRCDVVGTSRGGVAGMIRLDLSSPGDFDFSIVSAGDVVLLAAAMSSPDACTRQPDAARAINVSGTTDFIGRCLARGAKVVFFSSDTVYGGRADYFDETAQCNPAGAYAAMKHEVEMRFLGSARFKSLRLSYVFSKNDQFTLYLRDCAEKGTAARLFHPFLRAVVHLDDVVTALLNLARSWEEFPADLINIGGPEVISRVDIAGAVKELAAPGLAWTEVTPPPDFFVSRPSAICMRSPLVNALLGRSPRTIREAVEAEFPRMA